MTLLPPFTVSVSAKRPACVLDASAALQRHGLLLAARLAQEVDVWLSRSLWEILDNTPYSLPVSSHSDEPNGELMDGLRRWSAARVETDLARLPVYWTGAALHESSLPPHADKQIIQRFEAIAADFDHRAGAGRANVDGGIWSDCARDSLALALALSPANALVLVGGGPSLDIQDALKRADVPHRQLEGEACGMAAALYQPMLARTGVMELVWTGLDVAVLHVVAPGAPLGPLGWTEEDDSEEMAAIYEPEPPRGAAWQGAEVLWWRLGSAFGSGGGES